MGFKTPDHYFGSLDAAIFSRMEEANLSSKIDCSGFKVPDGYFENLDGKIFGSIEKEETSKIASLFSWKKAAYLTGIAASVILIFNILSNTSDELTFEDLETASIESYLMNEDLNAYDIAPYLGSNEINPDDFVKTTIKTSDIEDYLLQNSDVESLITD